MKDYLTYANSPVMWLAVIPAIILVLVEAALFTKRAFKTGKEMGITDEQFKSAMKASATSSIGPSFVVLIGMVTLMIAIGGPMSWMRLSYIGSVAFELGAASFASNACGVQLGSADMTAQVFATCCWVMCLGCLGWILVSIIFTDKMDKVKNKMAGGNAAKVAIISAGGGIGVYTYMALDRCFPASAQTVAVIAAAAIETVITLYGKKHKDKKWPSMWGMTISMFSGMIIGSFFM